MEPKLLLIFVTFFVFAFFVQEAEAISLYNTTSLLAVGGNVSSENYSLFIIISDFGSNVSNENFSLFVDPVEYISPYTSQPVSVDLSFTLFIPATNATGTASNATTFQILFNSTDVNAKKVNATAHGGLGGQQTAAVSIFRYNNTGTVAINIMLNFTTALPSGVSVKAGWADAAYESSCTAVNLTSTTACVNITGTLTRVANLSSGAGGGEARDVWLWADYSDVSVNIDAERNLSSISIQGA